MDSPSYLVRGFLEPIPSPQGGIPGWTRICFVIYDANRDFLKLVPSDNDDDDHDGDGDDDGSKKEALLPEEDWPPVDLRMDFIGSLAMRASCFREEESCWDSGLTWRGSMRNSAVEYSGMYREEAKSRKEIKGQKRGHTQ